MSLKTMLESPRVPIDEIAEYLDGFPHYARVHATRELSSKDLAALYRRAEGAPPLDLDYFVPPDRPPLDQVIHHGMNSLPAFRHFQKRFCRPIDPGARLYGYNEGVTRKLIGPGYFQTIPTAGNPLWEPRGAIVIDYFQIPDGAIDARWPRVVPNSRGLQRLVYFQTRDFMRRVSEHVSIGAAFKKEKPIGAYFVLVRQDR